MSTKQTEKFIQWLDEEEKRRDWTDYKLAKVAGFSHSVLSRARSGSLPKWDTCVAIAEAFDISPITVFRKAGLLPEGPKESATFDDWKFLFSGLSERDQEIIWDLMLNMRAKNEKDAKSTTKLGNTAAYS